MADEISFNDPWDIMMDPWDVFMGFDPILQHQIAWLIGLCSLVFFVVTIIVILLLGSASGGAQLQKDASARSKYMMGILYVIAAVMAVTTGIAVVFPTFM